MDAFDVRTSYTSKDFHLVSPHVILWHTLLSCGNAERAVLCLRLSRGHRKNCFFFSSLKSILKNSFNRVLDDFTAWVSFRLSWVPFSKPT